MNSKDTLYANIYDIILEQPIKIQPNHNFYFNKS